MAMSALIFGVIIGWVLEWFMDRRFWRQQRESALRNDHSEAMALQQQLDEQRREAKSELKELSQRERAASRELEEVRRRQVDQGALVDQLTLERDAAVQAKEQSAAQLTGELDGCKSRLAELNGEAAEARQTYQHMQVSLQKVEKELSEQRAAAAAEVSQLKVALEANEAEYLRRIEQLKAEVGEYASRLKSAEEALEATVDAAEAMSDHGDGPLEALQAELSEVQSRLKSAEEALEATVDAAEAMAEQGEAPLAELQAELSETQSRLKSAEEALEATIDAAEALAEVGDESNTSVAAAAESSLPDRLEDIRGIGRVFAKRLEEAGIDSFAKLVQTDPAQLCEVTGLRPGQAALAESWITQAQALLEG